jgi:hypothetical protein
MNHQGIGGSTLGTDRAYFLLFHGVQTGSGAHATAYPVNIGVFAPGIKRSEVRLIIHLHLLTMLRMRGAVPHSVIRFHVIVFNQTQGQLPFWPSKDTRRKKSVEGRRRKEKKKWLQGRGYTGKIKVFPVFNSALRYEDVWGSGGIASRTLNNVTSAQFQTPSLKKGPPVSFS